MKKGFSIVEMLIVMLLMSVMLVVMLPVLTIKKKTVFSTGGTPMEDSKTYAGRCIIDENALSIEYDTNGNLVTLQRLMSPNCSSAVENMKSTGSNDYNAAKNLAYNGTTTPANQQIAARKLMRAACENGSDDACGWFAEACDVDAGTCDLSDVDQNQYLDFKFYLDLLTSDTRTTRILAQGSDRYKTANNVYSDTSMLQTYLHSQCSNAIAANSTTGYNTMACQMIKGACSIGGIRACYHHVKDQCVDNERCTHLKDFIAITSSDNSQSGRAIVRNMLVAEDVYLEDENFTLLFNNTNILQSTKDICTVPSNTACEMIKWECDNDLHQASCLHIITPLCATTNQCSVLSTYLDKPYTIDLNKPEVKIRDLMVNNFSGSTVNTTINRCNAATAYASGIYTNAVIACEALELICGNKNNSSACTYFTGKCNDGVCDTYPSNNAQIYANFDFNYFSSFASSYISSISTFISDAAVKYLAGNTYIKGNIDLKCPSNICVGTENVACKIKYNGLGCTPVAVQAIENCDNGNSAACTTAYSNGWNTSCKRIKNTYQNGPNGPWPLPSAGHAYRLTSKGTSNIISYACDMTQANPVTLIEDWTTPGAKSTSNLVAGTYKFEALGGSGGSGGNGGNIGYTNGWLGSSGSSYACGGLGGGGGGGGASGLQTNGSTVIIAGGGGGSGGGGGACITQYYSHSMGGGGGGGGSKGVYAYGAQSLPANSSISAYVGYKGGDGGDGGNIANITVGGTPGIAGIGGNGFNSSRGGNGSGSGGNGYCIFGANGSDYGGGGGGHGGGGYNNGYSRCYGYRGGSGSPGAGPGYAYSTSDTSSSGGGSGHGGGGTACSWSVWNGGGRMSSCSSSTSITASGDGAGGGAFNTCNATLYSGGAGSGKGGFGGSACYNCSQNYGYYYGYATGGTGGTTDKGGNGGNGYGQASCWSSCSYAGYAGGGGGGGQYQGGGGGGVYSYSGEYPGGGGGGGAGAYTFSGLSSTGSTYDTQSGDGRIKIWLLD